MNTPWYILLSLWGPHQPANYNWGSCCLISLTCPGNSFVVSSHFPRIPCLYPLTNLCFLKNLTTFWKENSSHFDRSLEIMLSFLLYVYTIGRQSVQKAFEAHLNIKVTRTFLPLLLPSESGKRTAKQSLQKVALNEFLLE